MTLLLFTLSSGGEEKAKLNWFKFQLRHRKRTFKVEHYVVTRLEVKVGVSKDFVLVIPCLFFKIYSTLNLCFKCDSCIYDVY